MSGVFHKYPRTSHLLWLGEGVPREDKIMSFAQAEQFLSAPVVIEEKVDGANLGLSIGPDGRIRAQSRGDYLTPGRCHAQWNPLWPWLATHKHALAAVLGEKLILYGEWCYARHSIAYHALPDWFLAFDIFEKGETAFWSSGRRNAIAAEAGLWTVPELFRGHMDLAKVPSLIRTSELGAPKMEGIYLRREAEGRVRARAKVVGAEFIQQIEQHWTRHPLVPNELGLESHAR